MRLAQCLFIFFVVAYVTTSKTSKKRQIHNYLPYYEPNIVERQRFLKSSTTVTTTKILTAIYTITCTHSTTACTSSSSSSTTSSSTTSSSTATSSSSSSTTSSTSSTTSSTSSGPAGRRRREIDNIEAEDWTNEQLPIVPSNVQGVEATAAPVREGRFAHPQLLAMMPPFGYYQPQEIQSGFDSDPSLALPYYGSYVQPAAIGQPRIFFGALNGLLFPKFVVTKTETVTLVTIVPSTSTLSPTCSTANPGALQCPA